MSVFARRWSVRSFVALAALLGAPQLHAATFTVSKTADTNDGTCDADCSLREAIGAANGNGVPDTIAFNISVADPGYNAGTGVFTISPSPALPGIINAGTTIDGTTQTANVGNTNTAILGSGGTVGVGPDGIVSTGDESALAQVAGPEIEIRDGSGIAIGLHIRSNDTTIRGLAILGFGAANGEGDVVIDNNVTGTLIERNVIGSTANAFTDPGAALRGVAGVDSTGGDNGIVRNNLVGFHGVRGIWMNAGANGWDIEGNEVRDNGQDASDGDGIALTGSGSNNVTANLVAGSSSQGIVVTSAGSDNNTVLNNTFTGNGVGDSSGVVQSAAITLRGSAGPSVFERNWIYANYGAGLQLNNPAVSVRLTLNAFADNGTIVARDLSPVTGQIGIDLNAPGDDNNFGTSPFYSINDLNDTDGGGNNRLNFPIIDTATISGANLILNGWARPGSIIEFYVADADPSGFGEGEIYLATLTEGSGADTDAGSGTYGPGLINGIAQGTDNTNRYSFTIPTPAGVSLGTNLTATATLAGNTSEFSGRATVAVIHAISGTVFIDTVGDGLADGPIGGAANPGAGTVDVYLYDDSGATAGQPDATDGALGSVATAADGSYSFTGLVDGTYWVVVDSKTLSPDANIWAEQSYAPLGGWCADGTGGTTQGIGAAGVCYGGRRVDPVPANPSSDDLTTWHSGTEHLGQTTVAGAAVTAVDFGFSFNVVTTSRGGDATDDDGANPRTVQGSLRQFVQNANAIAGANAMRFVPAEPVNASAGGHSWWQISVSSAQPLITGASTVVDGAAYGFTDGTTPRDTNTAAIGTGASVGVSATFTTPQLDPELELRGDGVVNVGMEIRQTADNSSIRNMAINAFALNAVRFIGASADALDNASLDNNVLGTSPASFTDVPALSTGRALFARDLTNATIRDNLAGWFDWGFQIQFDTFDSLVETNEIRSSNTHGLYIAGVQATGQQPARITVRGNLVEASGTNAINTFEALNQFTITENTLRLSGSHAATVYPTQSTISSNVITDNAGAGLVIVGDNLPAFPAVSQTRISGNRFGANGQIAIDLVANGTNPDGITFNDDLDADLGGANQLHNFPVIESAVLAGGNLTVTGFARPGVDIEFYEAAGAANDNNSGGTPHGEGIAYLFTATEASAGDLDATTGAYASPAFGADTSAERFRFVVPAPAGLVLGEALSALSIDTTNDTSEFGPNATVTEPYQIIKRAFLPDGTPVGDGSSLPQGVEFKFLLYINNKDGATNDASIRDVLDPLFAFLPGTLQVDNSIAECAAAVCTPAEELAIFTSAIAAPLLTDAVDADVASFDGTDTIDAGDEHFANGQLNIGANSVLALVFSAKIQ